MGAYLSSPVTDKVSTDRSCPSFTYGASSMQGWRISQEDAHNCIPELDSRTSMFAVYDGHGGAEVAQYCSKFLPECIKQTEQYQEGDLGPALVDAFLKFDSTLVQEDVIKELKLLAGVDENDEEDDDDDPVGRGEADDLRAEADLPLDQLLAKYQQAPGGAAARSLLRKKDNLQSPALGRSKPDQSGGSDAVPSSSSEAGSRSPSGGGGEAPSSSAAGLTNGLADNENNLNKEKELQDNVPTQATGGGAASSSDIVSAAGDSAGVGKSTDNVLKSGGGSDVEEGGSQSEVLAADSSTSSSGGGGVVGSSGGSCDVGSSSSAPSSQLKSADAVSDGVSSSTPSAEGASSKKEGKNGPKKPLEEIYNDDDDDSEEEDEDEWQDMSGDEEEEDDDDEGMDDTDEPVMDMSNEEPGSDSGCTACVALLRGDTLIVANAGDSRCVLCRAGKAMDLSVDHKPEDDLERNRIEKAGGKVTADGRVNGGLNLSRALGDHFYKRKEDMSPEQQMITALPDIQTVTLVPEDQFLIVACDGIWNSMSSEECVEFVAERLKDPVKKAKPSLVCEELFDRCLAANTYGDGTGCDNMTCIIVVLNSPGQSEGVPTKRCVRDEEETHTENIEKRPRVEEGEGGQISC